MYATDLFSGRGLLSRADGTNARNVDLHAGESALSSPEFRSGWMARNPLWLEDDFLSDGSARASRCCCRQANHPRSASVANWRAPGCSPAAAFGSSIPRSLAPASNAPSVSCNHLVAHNGCRSRTVVCRISHALSRTLNGHLGTLAWVDFLNRRIGRVFPW